MENFAYRTYFFVKIAIVWIAILIIGYSPKGSINDAPLDLTTFIITGLFVSIWLAVFCGQSAFARFFFLKHPLKRSSLPELIVSIVLLITSFALIYLTSTVLVVVGSPWVMLFRGFFFESNAEIQRRGFLLFFAITLLSFYMHLCILLYDEDIEDTASAQLIRVVELVWLVGAIVNGLAGSVLNGAVAKDVSIFTIVLWSCWLLFIFISAVVMRFILFKDRITDTRNKVLLFLASYGLASVFFYFFNYIPSAIVFIKSLASLGFGNRYYFLSGALFNIVFSVLLLFSLYLMHSGILGYDEDEVYDEDVELDHREQYIPRNSGEYNREIYRINSAAEWATEERWDCGKKTESENRMTYSTGDNAEGKREVPVSNIKLGKTSVKRVKEKERLIQTGAIIWLLGWFINFWFALWFGFFRWSLWFICILTPPVMMRFVFLKRPTTDWKNKILLFLAGNMVVSVVSFAFGVRYIPSLILLIQMLMLPVFAPGSPYYLLFPIGPFALSDLISTTFLLSAFFYLHSAILSYGSDKEEE
ncbi:MAG: hypothetical protein KBH12_07395 [Synergistaceae bacterium]|nr:hypothetical protein [Synergistaceae bacterium]MBP9626434.1 hypothetical protein [Synergistaceae bacterium]MBP9957823.1 hypothetical protein [Synergistaceae bacterium]